jgi:hypothetical protein
MITPPEYYYDLAGAMAFARNFAIEKKLYYIDSNVIGWSILRSGYRLPEGIDTQAIMSEIEKMYEKAATLPEVEDNMIPLTYESDHMLKTAGDYAAALNDKSTTPAHVMLAMLSYENNFELLLSRQGWVFYEQLQYSFGSHKI